MNTSTIEDDGVNILKGYTFRMYPNEKQKELINTTSFKLYIKNPATPCFYK